MKDINQKNTIVKNINKKNTKLINNLGITYGILAIILDFIFKKRKELRIHNAEHLSLTDRIQTLLVLELRNDKNIHKNQDKIKFIDEVGAMLCDGKIDTNKKLINALNTFLKDRKIKNANDLIKNLKKVLAIDSLDNKEGRFSGAERNVKNEKSELIKAKNANTYLQISKQFYVKKITKPDQLKNGKTFSNSKFNNIHYKKKVRDDYKILCFKIENPVNVFGDIVHDLYISKMFEVLFADKDNYKHLHDKVRQSSDDQNKVFVKIDENAMDVKGRKKKIDLKSGRLAIITYAFFGIGDRHHENLILDSQGRVKNIDFGVMNKGLLFDAINKFAKNEITKEKFSQDAMNSYFYEQNVDQMNRKVRQAYKIAPERHIIKNSTQDDWRASLDEFISLFTPEKINQLQQINAEWIAKQNEYKANKKNQALKGGKADISTNLIFISQEIAKIPTKKI